MTMVAGLPACELAETFGTPLFVYDADRMRRNIHAIDAAFAAHRRRRIYYSLKANPSLALAAVALDAGLGLDASSVGDVEVARRSGAPDELISVTGLCLSDDELRFLATTRADIQLDAPGQAIRFAAERPRKDEIGFRVNPGIGSGFLDVCVGGGPESKFGIQLDDVPREVDAARAAGLVPRGLHFHVGSGNLSVAPFVDALVATLRAAASAMRLDHVSIGGGFGVAYAPWIKPLDIDALGAAIVEALHAELGSVASSVELRMEPGERIVADAGHLLTRVVGVKHVRDGRPGEPAERRFAIVDTSINHLPGAGMYGTDYPMTVVGKEERGRFAGCLPYHVVGNLNQSQDALGPVRELPSLEAGDLIAIGMAGAYAMSRASRFNGRLLPSEVLVLDGAAHVIRPRETQDVLWQSQSVPSSLLARAASQHAVDGRDD